MAKSLSFFGLRKGSTKSMTFSVLKGQQITKDRVTEVINPQTLQQMLQRIPFANTIKFYKHATQSLFKFAYEDKRYHESDYNAFVRHNIRRSASVSKEDYANDKYPSLGSWLLTQGSLEKALYSVGGAKLGLFILQEGEDTETIGKLSEDILRNYPFLMVGDIVTFVCYSSALNTSGHLEDGSAPRMDLLQFVINPSDETDLEEIGLNYAQGLDDIVSWSCGYEDLAWCGAVIFSRNTRTGLKVSTAAVLGNDVWKYFTSEASTLYVREEYAKQWSANNNAVLDGSQIPMENPSVGTFVCNDREPLTEQRRYYEVDFNDSHLISADDYVSLNGVVGIASGVDFKFTIGRFIVHLVRAKNSLGALRNFISFTSKVEGDSFSPETIVLNGKTYRIQ